MSLTGYVRSGMLQYMGTDQQPTRQDGVRRGLRVLARLIARVELERTANTGDPHVRAADHSVSARPNANDERVSDEE